MLEAAFLWPPGHMSILTVGCGCRGWYHMDAEATNVMEMENIAPDSWIVPNRMTSYAAMGSLAETEVYRAGETVARGNLEQGKNRFTTFRGKSVYETKPYQLDVDGRVVDPLNRTRMIGDFFVVPYYGMKNGNNTVGPQARGGQTQVYCCESDRFETFSWKNLAEQSDFGNVSAELFKEWSRDLMGDYTFADIENLTRLDERGGHRLSHIGFMRALAIHDALSKNSHNNNGQGKGDAKEMLDYLLSIDDSTMDEAAVHKINDLFDAHLPPWLKGYHVGARLPRGGTGQATKDFYDACQAARKDLGEAACKERGYGTPGNLYHVRSSHAAFPGISSATHAAVESAIDMSIRNAFGADIEPSNAQQCASSWGRAVSQAGFDDETAHRCMARALGETVCKYVFGNAEEGADEIEKIHVDPSTGARKTTAEAAEDLHDAYLRGNDPDGPFAAYMQEAEPLAIAYAESSGMDAAQASGNPAEPFNKEERCTEATYPADAFFKYADALHAHKASALDKWVNFTNKCKFAYTNNSYPDLHWHSYRTARNSYEESKEALIPVTGHLIHMKCDKGFYKWNPLDDANSGQAIAADKTEIGGYDLLCVRPFRQYTMGTGVLLKKGNELGNTFRGWADFQLTDNIIAKTHIGHFTFWHASIVTNPKCLFLAEDIFCTSYISGEGSKVLSWQHINEFREDPLGTMAKYRASIICLPVPVGAIDPVDKRLQMNNPISLTGVLDPSMRAAAGRESAACVNIGDYELLHKTRDAYAKLASMWDNQNKNYGAPEMANMEAPVLIEGPDPNPRPCYCHEGEPEQPLSGQVYSDMYSELFGFHTMNHGNLIF